MYWICYLLLALTNVSLGSIVSVLVELWQLLMQEFLTACLSGMGSGEVKNAKDGYIQDALDERLTVSRNLGL